MHPQPGDNQRRGKPTVGLMQFGALGLELGGGIVGFVLLGWWVDRQFDSRPWGVSAGAVLGCVGGMYSLIRHAIAIQKKLEQQGPSPAAHESRAGDTAPDDAADPGQAARRSAPDTERQRPGPSSTNDYQEG